MCERFLFDAELQYSRIGKLSGGQKRRLNLLRVLMEAPNVLCWMSRPMIWISVH